jgi:D-tyrosyl-tRNA(Tyr) deacylase
LIAVIQRVLKAGVSIEQETDRVIGKGLLVLLGIENADDETDIDWLSRKIVQLRIFDDENGVMNRNIADVDGEILLVSQFTLHASTKKGNRPSYIKAAKPDVAIPLYEAFIRKLTDVFYKPVATGTFGAMMQVSLINDGPVTIIIDTKDKK